MTELQDQVLLTINEKKETDSLELASLLKVDHQRIVGILKSIHSFGDLIDCQQETIKSWQLTDEGQLIAQNGSYEARLFDTIPISDGIPQTDLMKLVENSKIGFSKAMSCGWILLDKKCDGGPRVFRKIEKINDSVKNMCCMLDSVDENCKTELKKRKLAQQVTITIFKVAKGPKFTLKLEKQETDLTIEMLNTGSWKEKSFKAYNFNSLGVMPPSGHLHPLLKVRTEFRQIFLEMGFTEMPTNNWIESSFWNFDALFQPQQHPARDAHDTFFISEPANAIRSKIPQDYLERVSEVHSVGGYKSLGYQYDWKIEEAEKNILRTHTTAVSARMLYKLAQEEKFDE